MRAFFILLLFTLNFWNAKVFTKNKEFVYLVQYHQNELDITTNEKISLSITGNLWKKAAEQKEAIWHYQTKSKTKITFKDQFSLGWLFTDTTGVVENETKIWLHPPRNNQYTLTEIAPFPDFRKNKKVGDTYSSVTLLGSGLGPWNGKKVKCNYSISNVCKGMEDSLWTIKGISEIEGKQNNCEFIFSDRRGFIKMTYSFFNGNSMKMELKK
jgi:hypothetical protein